MREIIFSNANENWYIILYDLFSRLWYIATCGPFCKDDTHIILLLYMLFPNFNFIPSCLLIIVIIIVVRVSMNVLP